MNTLSFWLYIDTQTDSIEKACVPKTKKIMDVLQEQVQNVLFLIFQVSVSSQSAPLFPSFLAFGPFSCSG